MSEQISDVIGAYVFGRTQALLNGSPMSRQNLALLRKGVGHRPDDLPDVWGVVFADAPDVLYGDGSVVSKPEEAVFMALTFFAKHASGSNAKAAFASGISLTAGLAKLRPVGKPITENTALCREAQKLMTSKSLSELKAHSQRVISRCRSAGVGIDYGLLAKDIFWWSLGGDSRKRVLLRWSRDFYGINKKEVVSYG